MPLWDNYSHQVKDLPELSSPSTDTDIVLYSNPGKGMGVKKMTTKHMPITQMRTLPLGFLNNATAYLNTTNKQYTRVPWQSTLYSLSMTATRVYTTNSGGQPGINMASSVGPTSFLNGSTTISALAALGSTATSTSWTQPFASITAISNSSPGLTRLGEAILFYTPAATATTLMNTGNTDFILDVWAG